jgi:hypothetical protein
MAYTFDGVDQSLTSAGADLTDAYPSTVACWARCADNSVANGMVYAIHNGVASSHRVVLRMTNTGAAAFGVLGATTSDSTGPTYQSNTWHSCIYVLTSTTSRIGYVDGSAGPAQTTDTGAVASLAETAIGVNWSSGAYADYFLGEIMNFGIWNVVLTADERAALDLGISPQLIRPGSLVFFRSLINPLNHPFLGSTLTNNNTATVSVHSRLILPANGFIGASVNTLSVAVEDSVTVGESAGMDVSNYMISVADAVTVGETTIISVGSGFRLYRGRYADGGEHQPHQQCRYGYGGHYRRGGHVVLHLRRGDAGRSARAPSPFCPDEKGATLMAVEVKMLGQLRPADTTAAAIYTKAQDSKVWLDKMYVCNTTGSTATFKLCIDEDGSTYDETTALYWNVDVPTKKTLT